MIIDQSSSDDVHAMFVLKTHMQVCGFLFESDKKKPKGTLGNQFFLLRGSTKRVGGGQEPPKTLLRLFKQQN